MFGFCDVRCNARNNPAESAGRGVHRTIKIMKIEEGVFVVRDDMSRAGLRRLHLLGHVPVYADFYLSQMLTDGGTVQMVARYEDDIGNFHLYMAWRMVMEKMVVFAIDGGDVVQATGEAAVSYYERLGVWPDRAVVRVGMDGPKGIELINEEEVVGKVMIERVDWMRNGDVGVYRKTPNEAGLKGDGGRETDPTGLLREECE